MHFPGCCSRKLSHFSAHGDSLSRQALYKSLSPCRSPLSPLKACPVLYMHFPGCCSSRLMHFSAHGDSLSRLSLHRPLLLSRLYVHLLRGIRRHEATHSNYNGSPLTILSIKYPLRLLVLPLQSNVQPPSIAAESHLYLLALQAHPAPPTSELFEAASPSFFLLQSVLSKTFLLTYAALPPSP